ncbi:MAG: DUF4132 domain-containing protein [Leptolyngbya sp. SIO1E4]|nr:DUF4132 domain-containing protein [Leptolyngbya sp. SIO1E4]
MMPDLKNPLSLSPAVLKPLKSWLSMFGELDIGFPDRLLRYLVDGEDEAVVEAVVSAVHYQQTQYMNGLNQQPFTHQSSLVRPILGLLQHVDTDDNPLRKIASSIAMSEISFLGRLVYLWGNFSEGAVYTYLSSGQSSRQVSIQTCLQPLKHCLLKFIESVTVPQRWGTQAATCPVTAEMIDALYVEAGEPAGTLCRMAYIIDPSDYRESQLALHIVHLDGFAEYTLKHISIVQEALQQPERGRRIHALQLLTKEKVPPGEFIDMLVNLAVSSAKTEREPAGVLLQQDPQAAIPLLQTKAELGSSSERQHAVKLLWEFAGDAMRPFLEARLEAEKAAKVRSTLEQLMTTVSEVTVEASSVALPPLPPVDFEAPLPKSALDLCEHIREEYRQYLLHENPSRDPQKLDCVVDSMLSALIARLQTGTYEDCTKRQHGFWNRSSLKEKARTLMTLADFQLIHAMRLVILLGCVISKECSRNPYHLVLNDDGHNLLLLYSRHHSETNDLRQLATVFEVLKLDPELIGNELLNNRQNRGFWRWDDDAIWPYFAERLHRLQDTLTLKIDADWWARYESRGLRANAFRVLKTFPQPPAHLIPMFWELAFHGPKDERIIARNGLNTLEDTQARLLTTLSDPNRDRRMVVAEWLGDRNDAAAIEPLKQALKKEKSEGAKDVMLRSLEKLGASVDDFLDRKHLLKDLQKFLKKGVPSTLAWFPFATLPIIHWRDTGEVVDPDILKGLILQCFKQKTPEPGPILRRYVDQWQADDREALGQFVLKSWIAQDTIPTYTPQEAEQRAQRLANQEFQYYQQLQQQHPNAIGAYYSVTYDQLYQRHYSQLISDCKGSATKEKGILAISSACCGAAAIAPINTYLKTWYGKRMAQCNALLQTLAWLENNSATQLLLSIANRFRTKSIQKEAAKLVSKLAERKGWSRDELSDRTIPTVGFDQGVEQALDYGSRQFTLLLDADMNLVLKNPDGKAIKSLPAARKTDDPDLAKAAKKQLSDAKKQLKQVLKMQRERLYEAMCTQRSWRFADWNLYLNQHPIVGRYCQQLVWAIYDGDTLVQTFRPLEDRTFTDAEDEAVTPAAEAVIRLVHSGTVSTDTATAWQTHLADYDVMPLLQQFRPHPYGLPVAQQQNTQLTSFEGHLIEAFQLRGLAAKRGYTRGQTQDAGWFYDYRKAFSSLGIEAVIEFSGNFLPEENRTVALTRLSFRQLPEEAEADYSYSYTELPLGDIPAVLLSETWNDLQAIAAQGSGYDSDWQKKVEY